MNHLQYLKTKTKEVILFHSATGKDSICLLDMLSKHNFNIQCVFMYIVKDLDYENRYIEWAKKKYNVNFYQTPHYAVYSFIKNGYLGIKKDSSIRKYKISDIDKMVKEKFKINWSVYGFKKNDGVTRRLMLNSYINGLSIKTNKAYPLMDYTNKKVLKYIQKNKLLNPFNYNPLKPSSGCDISDPVFLNFLSKKYPEDLKKIIAQFPFTEINLFKFQTNNA